MKNFGAIAWNLLGGIVTGGSMIVTAKICINQLGMENYAVIGLLMAGQTLIGIFDLGFSATIIKVFSISSTNPRLGSEIEGKRLRTFENVYLLLSGFCFILIFLGLTCIL
jgi:hypothetical protein